jgi:hypothetical protein
MKTRLIFLACLACAATAACADDSRRYSIITGFVIGIDQSDTGVLDVGGRGDNAHLHDATNNMVGFLVRKARRKSKHSGLSHTTEYETSSITYKVGANKEKVLFKVKYRY